MSHALRVLYVMDPLPASHPDKDSTFHLMLEAQARGSLAWVCGVEALSTDGARGFAFAQRATVRRPTEADANHARLDPPERVWLETFDVIWMRKDPPVDEAYLYATHLLERVPAETTLVLNNPSQLRVVHEKLWGLSYPELGPRTVVSARADVLVDFVKTEGRGVLKPLHLMGGIGVLAFDANDKNLRSAADLLTQENRRHAIAQAYIPQVTAGDKRVILLDGEPVGALLRVPRADDVRSNMHAGGSAERAVIDDADRRIAARIGPELARLGMFFVGIDVIGGLLTEVNVTSPTGLQEIDRLDGRTGADRMSAMVWDRVEQKRAHQRGSPTPSA